MSRVIVVLASGLALGACSMPMPSLDFMKSSSGTELLRIESEPPGADARTALGESCRTPCELTVANGGDVAVSFALNGYQPQTVQLHADGSSARLQPNPVYAELQPVKVPAAKKKAPARKTARAAPPPPPTETASAPVTSTTTSSAAAYPGAFAWPDPQTR
jgi:hypothetical protein